MEVARPRVYNRENMDAATDSASAKKLKACINCTNAKTKCTPFANLSNLCERCHRLGKICAYSEAVVRPKKNRISSRKQLEEKVDSLVNILSTIQSGQSTSNAPPIANGRSPALPVTAVQPAPQAQQASPSDSALGSSCVETPKHLDDASIEVLDALPLELINELFSKYCTEIAPGFPFVTFAPSETVSTMRINRPLTLKSLLTAALYRDANTQRKACIEMGVLIKRAMMSRTTYSFDVLQAILIQTAFYHYQFRPQKQELLMMVQFAVVLTHELGIDKSPIDKRTGMTLNHLRTTSAEGVRYEQWRALLGAFYQAGVFTQAFRKPKLMQYTKYMDRCRQRLLESIELQTDYTIDVMIGASNVCLDINETFTLYDVENADVSGDLAIKSLVTGFMNELKMLEERTQHRRSGTLLAVEQRVLAYAKVYAHEAAVHRDLWPSSDSAVPAVSPTRIQLGWTGLELARQLLSLYAYTPAEDLFRFDTAPVTQMLYSLLMLNKFIALDSTDEAPIQGSGLWDMQLAFREADVEKLGGMLVDKIATLVKDERLYDESRPFHWSLGWIVKNMVDGHKQWLSGCLHSTEELEAKIDSDEPFKKADAAESQSDPSQNFTGLTMSGTPGVGEAHTFSSAFPDVSFDGTMNWQNGIFQNFVWDTMMNDMTTLPFG